MLRQSLVRSLAVSTFAVASLAGCKHDIKSPEPGLSSVTPDLVCNGAVVSSPDGVTNVALAGSDFTPMPSDTLKDPRQLILPAITLDPRDPLPGGTAATAPVTIHDDPTDPGNSRVHWDSETSMSFDVHAEDMLPPGTFDVTVTNPDGSSASTLDQILAIIPPPVVSMVEPPAICDAESDQTLVVTGTNFLVFDGATPTITLGTSPNQHTYTSTFDPADCAAIPGTYTEQNVELCTKISFTVPTGDIPVDTTTMLDLVVTNPAPADCASSDAIQVTIEPPPRVDNVVPGTVCEGGSQITINGANFLPGATVIMDCGGTQVSASNVDVNADGTQIAATFGGGAVPGQCDIIVQNPDGCTDLPPHKTINVSTGPIVFFVDPDVAYNGINTQITIYATTITPGLPADAVTIALPGGSPIQLAYTYPVPGHANRVQAIVPVGTPASATPYDLTFKDGSGCTATLPQALTVTDTTTVTLKNVDPPFGYTNVDTAVTVFRDTTAPAPNDAPFVETPRVFLNPTNAAPGDVAVAMQSVAFLDSNRVTGVVPKGTPAHAYDVVLVNPDGTVGLLPDGYTETANPTPEIDSATPASIVDATGQVVVLGGENFDPADTITLTCVDATGAPEASPNLTSQPPSCTGADCTQQITIDGSTLTIGSVCVVRLTNPDGSYGDFSAIGVTNASLNLSAPHAGPDMNVGRRALSAGAGNATGANRFLYAIGGDTGAASGALDSVEYAPVDLFGTIGAFQTTTPSLRAATTLAGAVTIGRYMYLIGGDNGAGATASAQRALILSPRETPVITDVDLALTDTGLDPGKYHYRVSAFFTPGDPDMAGGESLPSDEQTVRVPSFPNKKITTTLVWTAPVDSLGAPLSNVAGYDIYRTPTADAAPGTEVLIGTAGPTATTFADDGTATPGTQVPVPLGATGNWAALPDLTSCAPATACSAREGEAVAFAKDPAAGSQRGVPTTFYVYALLGSDGTHALASYEYLTITTEPDGRQDAAPAWTPGTMSSAHARWQLNAWTVDSTVDAIYGTDSYVFIGGGEQFGGGGQTTVEAGLVTPGGQLTIAADTAVRDFGAAQWGYGVCAANDQLFSFGGLNGAPSKNAKSASLASPPPTLASGAWNDEGLSTVHGRYLLGSAVRSSFIFLLGGQTDEPSPASKTTELVIW